MQGDVESSHCRNVFLTEPERCFSEALPLFEKMTDKAASEDRSATTAALGVTRFDKTPVLKMDENDELLYIKAAAVHTRGRKQSETFNGGVFYLYAPSLLQKLRSIRSTACKKHPLRLDAFLLTETSQTKTSSRPVKKMY